MRLQHRTPPTVFAAGWPARPRSITSALNALAARADAERWPFERYEREHARITRPTRHASEADSAK